MAGMEQSLGKFEVGPFTCACAVHRGESRAATVEVFVDAAALARAYGRRAIHSKGRRSVEAGGRVVVKVVG